MQDERSLSKIEANCNQLLNSPYLQKEVPTELKNLRIVLEKVMLLVREDVPSLVSEIRHLRNQNRKLEAELEAMRYSQLNVPAENQEPMGQADTQVEAQAEEISEEKADPTVKSEEAVTAETA